MAEETERLTTDELVLLAELMGWNETDCAPGYFVDDQGRVGIHTYDDYGWEPFNPGENTIDGREQAYRLLEAWCGDTGNYALYRIVDRDRRYRIDIMQSARHTYTGDGDTPNNAICRAVLAAVDDK